MGGIGMTYEEFCNLYNKISDVIDGFKDYHYYYYCCNETYNGTSMTFEVHIHSDQGEGYDCVEDWRIDEFGRIHSEDEIYESYDEFLREWV